MALKYIKQNDELQSFSQWERGQTIPVRFRGVGDYEKKLITDYCIAKINSLPLDIKLAVSDASQAASGGITITFDNKISSISTRATYGASTKPAEGQPYVFDVCIQSIKASSLILDGFKPPTGYDANSNYDNAVRNAILHELLHAIGYLKHMPSYTKPGKIIFKPLMANGLSSATLEWTYSDEIRLLWMYGTAPGRSKTFSFEQEQIGLWCFMINTMKRNRSIVFKVTDQKMTIDYWIPGVYKRIVTDAEVHDD